MVHYVTGKKRRLLLQFKDDRRVRTMPRSRLAAETGCGNGAIYIHLIRETGRDDGVDTVRLSREARARTFIKIDGSVKN